MFTPLPTLRRLCATYDRMGKDSLIVDFRRMDRWYEAAERAVEGSFATARNNGMVRTALCRCLTCYFYLSHAERDDEWYAYLTQTADEWTASLTPDGLWEGITIPEALERIEVMNRISYMLLDHSRDADIRRVYNCYAKRIHNLSKHSAPVLERWYTLCTEGNAIPFKPEEARKTADRLCRMGRKKYSNAEREMKRWNLQE